MRGLGLGAARRQHLGVVESRKSVGADAPRLERPLDLVEPLVDEPFLREGPRRVIAPLVRDDRAESGAEHLRGGSDRAAPAAQRHAAVGRPHDEDGVDRTDPRATEHGPEVSCDVPRARPQGVRARRREGTDEPVHLDDVDEVERRGAVTPEVDGGRHPSQLVADRRDLVGARRAPRVPGRAGRRPPSDVRRPIQQGDRAPCRDGRHGRRVDPPDATGAIPDARPRSARPVRSMVCRRRRLCVSA